MKVMLAGALMVLLLGTTPTPTPRLDKLERRVATLESDVRWLVGQAKVRNEAIGQEYALSDEDRAVYEEVVKLKKELKECKEMEVRDGQNKN